MQEKDKNVCTVRFLTNYGRHVYVGEKFYEDDDTCDQRAPVNDPQDLYNMFIVPEDIMEELENETLQDFDNDDYEYDDISEFGEDIAAASRLDLKSSKEKLKKLKKKEAAEHLDEVDVDADEPSEA